MKRFDLLGPLPDQNSTTVLEASAGTGKTFTLAGLVTRYVAEGVATLDEMLLITFGRAASQELRERVRSQIRDAAEVLSGAASAGDNELIRHLCDAPPDVVAARAERLRAALAGFDAATIATTHQFCNLVLKSLGVVGDTDAGVTLVDNVDDLVVEIVDDIYLARFGQQRTDPPFSRAVALTLAREVVRNPGVELRPADPEPDSPAAARKAFAIEVLSELEHRKRRLGVLGYDDLLTRLAAVLAPADSPARDRMSRRWRIVMVDEFQDTDPVQWQVIERAFVGRCTVVLIGDPKQAIYAFRGGDIVTYLAAARSAGDRRTLGDNWRSDEILVDSLQTVLGGAALGDPEIVVRDVTARHSGHRLSGAPRNAAFRLRVVSRETLGVRDDRIIPIERLRRHIGADLAADIGALLGSGATFAGRRLRAADIAVIVETHRDARACHDALTAAGIPAVYTGDTDVFASRAAADWLCLLEAFDQPHRSGLVRAAATTMFFGHTADELAEGGDVLTDRVADVLREWAGQARERGGAAVFEAARRSGMARRVLSWQGGERHMTDLAHLAQLLHDTAHREHYGLPALRDWLRSQCTDGAAGAEGVRNRRLDSDAAAVQIMTVWVSKGLQYPVVYLPYAFTRRVGNQREFVLYHDNGVRCLHIGGAGSPDYDQVQALGRIEAGNDDIRLTYVALTRAQSQVVAWWAPGNDEPNGGLSRLLRGRGLGDVEVPLQCSPAKGVSDDEALWIFGRWQDAGGLTVEHSIAAEPVAIERRPVPDTLASRHFHRGIDTSWRRTSYSGLIRAVETSGVSSEPDVAGKDDETDEVPTETDEQPAGADVPSPMADIPAGAALGSLVHAVLEQADPFAVDLGAELERHVRANAVWWPVDVAPDVLAEAMLALHDTGLGPLAGGLTLRDIGRCDRLCELDFEFPLAGGDLVDAQRREVRLSDVGALLGEYLSADDPLAPYAARLRSVELGGQSLRGYLSGSIDVVLRVPYEGGHRYLVVDYKTNRLGDPNRPLTAADYTAPMLTRAMLHTDYPLQALLYSVVLHRYLRWRLPGYHPDEHIAGVLYLFVRGMSGPAGPVVGGVPAGVFSWHPPTGLVAALSDLLDGGPVES